MKMISAYFFVFVSFFLITVNSNAQTYSNWYGYPPINCINGLVEFKGYLYGATNGGFFRYDPENKTYKNYYKNNGLISNDVTCVAATSEKIYIGFIKNGLWSYDPDNEQFEQILFPEYHIKTSTDPNGIRLNNIYAKNDSILYVCHAKGIDMLNLKSEEIRTYSELGSGINKDTSVNRIKIHDGKIWACTAAGLAVADENNQNLEFKENWKSYTYQTSGITSIVFVNDIYQTNKIYAGTNGKGMITLNNTTDKLEMDIGSLGNAVIYDLEEALDGYWAAADSGLFFKQVTIWTRKNKQYYDITELAPGTDGRLWLGTLRKGFKCFSDKGFLDIQESELRASKFYDIDITPTGSLWAATAYRDEDMASALFLKLQNEKWVAYSGVFYSRTGCTLADTKGNVWLGTWGNGVYALEDDGELSTAADTLVNVNPNKDIIKPTNASYYVICTDFDEDSKGNIWIANYQESSSYENVPSSGAVVVDGYPITKYQQYSPAKDGLPTAQIRKICADEDGWVWMGTFKTGLVGLYVGNDPFIKTNMRAPITLSLSNGILSTLIVAIDYDKDGYVWVGSDGGLNRITKNGTTLKVEDMSSLLANASTDVKSIEVDNYNNKWIGTAGGLVKINSDNELEETYTTDNSGLFSDTILSLVYQKNTDILWIGTPSGLNRFSPLSSNENKIKKEIHFYPNPFEIWGSNSEATFTNLKIDSKVDIYSFSGAHLQQLSATDELSDGSAQVVWSGRNFENKYVGSGVYFYSCTDSDGKKIWDKIVVIRR